MPNEHEISEAHKQGTHKGLHEFNITGEFDMSKVPQYIKVLTDLYETMNSNIHSWIDIGCGHGEFIIALKQFSNNMLNVTGTEPNIFKQKSARKKGLNVSYIDLSTHKEKYDGISLLNVYSHLPDPPSFFKTLKNLLNPNGELIIQTGDTARLKANEHYRPFYLPDHLSFASEEIITNMLERLDFEIKSVKKYPYPSKIKSNLGLKRILKETAKMSLPGYHSDIPKYIHEFTNRKLYSDTDMYIRAKVKN